MQQRDLCLAAPLVLPSPRGTSSFQEALSRARGTHEKTQTEGEAMSRVPGSAVSGTMNLKNSSQVPSESAG